MKNFKNEIILYQLDELPEHIEVRLGDETVWLSMNQIAQLFNRDKSVISRHLSNVYKEGELSHNATVAKNATVQIEAGRQVTREIEYYNLDVIISVGYRVKSKQGTQFRIWATRVLKDYLLKGYAINNRMNRLEDNFDSLKSKVDQIDLQINTGLVPKQGVFFDGQIFDAYELASRIIRSAKREIILIANYIDESTLTHLSKKAKNVKALLLTKSITKSLALDVNKAKEQYGYYEVKELKNSHDRFLIIDHKDLYHLGASLKDLGKKWFAFSKMDDSMALLILEQLHKEAAI
jgi:hypothetical protein